MFREWDTDGDGEVSRKEFHKAMPLLGLDVAKEEIDKLFNEWDPGARSFGNSNEWDCGDGKEVGGALGDE